jgi:hypothetical protein
MGAGSLILSAKYSGQRQQRLERVRESRDECDVWFVIFRIFIMMTRRFGSVKTRKMDDGDEQHEWQSSKLSVIIIPNLATLPMDVRSPVATTYQRSDGVELRTPPPSHWNDRRTVVTMPTLRTKLPLILLRFLIAPS